MLDQVNDALRQAIGGVLTSLGSFLPIVVGLVVAVVVAALFGWLLSALCGRVLQWLRFDQRLVGENVGIDGDGVEQHALADIA